MRGMPKSRPIVLLLFLLPAASLAENEKDPGDLPRLRRQSRRHVREEARAMDPPAGASRIKIPKLTVDEDTAFWGRQLGASAATSDDDPSAKSLVGTYEDQFGTIVTIDKDSVTISYDCLKGYEDYPSSTFVILPQYTEPLSAAPKGSMYVVAYNDKNENDEPDPGEYTRFDYVLETPDGALYYCEIAWGEQSVESAIVDGTGATAADPTNLESGCNTYPWAKLHPYSGSC